MAAEALVVLGREDAVVPWVESYAGRLGDDIPATAPIDPNDWAPALGDRSRTRDWVNLFSRELDQGAYGDVLERWIPRLAPGLRAVATHGLIRTAHASRSLDADVNALRLEELARGLGYWAGHYATLPARAPESTHAPEPTIEAALARVQRVAVRGRGGSIDGCLREVGEDPSFGDVINLLEAPAEPGLALSALTAAMARIYLANVALGTTHDIAFIHAVTAPSALRLIAPQLQPAAVHAALRYAWRAVAAIHAAYSDLDVPRAGKIGVELDTDPISADDLIDRAVATGDEHAIKYSEACLREFALRPDPVYLTAARTAVERMER